MTPNEDTLIHDFDSATPSNKFPLAVFIGLLLIVIVLGGGIGFALSTLQKTGGSSSQTSNSPAKETAGIADKKTFKDNAEGILKEGGMDGEGSFHLQRPGGVSQNVYLTSSTVDLSAYVGKKVRVWGQTFEAQKAGWFMDVGLVETL